MKNLITFINEKLSMQWWGATTELFKLFDRDCGKSMKTTFKDVLNKKNFTVYALDIDNDKQKVIGEYELIVKEIVLSDKTASFKMDAAKEYGDVPQHIKNYMSRLLPKYWSCRDLWFNYKKGTDSAAAVDDEGVLYLDSNQEWGKGFAVIALSKENKEIFTNWIENLDTTEFEEIEKAARKAAEEKRKAEEKAEKERKRNLKPKKPTYNTKSSLIKIPNDFYYDKELGGESLIKAAIKEFKNGWAGETMFTAKQIKDLFKDINDENFGIIEYDGNSSGHTEADDAIESIFKKGSWWDYTPEYSQEGFGDNSILMKFKSKDDRKIYVIDSGDMGYAWVCVEF